MERRFRVFGILSLGGARIGGILLGFATTTLLARSLGPADFGVYSLLIAWQGLLALAGECGLRTVIVTEVSRLHGSLTLLPSYLFARLTVAVLLIICSLLCNLIWAPELWIYFAITLLPLLFSPFQLDWYLLIVSQYRFTTWATVSRWIITFVFTWFFWQLDILNLLTACIGFALGWFGSAALSLVLCWLRRDEIPHETLPREKKSMYSLVKGGIPIVVANLLIQLIQTGDILWLGIKQEPHQIGIYQLATTMTAALGLFANAYGQLVLSRYPSLGDKVGVPKRTFWFDLAAVSGLGIGMACALVLASFFIVPVFGEEYAESANLTMFFAPCLALYHLFTFLHSALIAAKRQRDALHTLIWLSPLYLVFLFIADALQGLQFYTLAKVLIILIATLALLITYLRSTAQRRE